MGSSTRTETTTQNTKTEPWDGAKPYYSDLYASAEAARKSGTPNPYPNSTVIDWSQPTQDAYTNIEAIARNGSPLLGNASNTANNIMTGAAYSGTPTSTYEGLQQGLNPTANPYSGMVNAVANGALSNGFGGSSALQAGSQWHNPGVAATAGAATTINNNAGNVLMQNGLTGSNAGMPLAQQAAHSASYNPALGAFGGASNYNNAALGGQSLLASFLGTNNNPATSMLQSTASGDYLNSNPYIDTAIKNANQGLADQYNDVIAPGIDSKFASAGRLGSAAYAASRNSSDRTVANAMAQNAGNMMASNYATERGNQLNAQNQIGALYNSDIGNLQTALGALSGTSNTQQAQRLAAITGMGSTADSVARNQIAASNNVANIDAQQQQTNNAALNSAGNLNNATSAQYLAAANQLGNQSAAQQTNNLNYLNSMSDLYKYDTSNQVNAINTGANLANQDFANTLSNANLQLNAANGQTSAQNAQVSQQMQAAGMAGALRQNDYADAQALLNVGQAEQARDGAFLQDDINRWNQTQNATWVGLQNQANILNGGGFNNSSGTQTKPIYTNNMAQATGALGSIAGLIAK